MRRRTIAGLLVGLIVAACGTPQATYDVTVPNVFVGAERSCADLDLSELRCTAIILRAAAQLGELRPGHAPVKSESLHEKGQPPAGESVAPLTVDVPAIVVFVLDDGTQVAVPVLCPRGGSTTDNACNPHVQ